jgi:hypothetical protein
MNPNPTLIFELLRPDDLLALRVLGVNFALDSSDAQKPKLVVRSHLKPAYLIFEFPPQSIAEKAYFETVNSGPGSDLLDEPGAVPARMAGPSRLVFQLKKNVTEVPFTLAGLLDWSKLNLVLSPTATGAAVPPPLTPPTSQETALEIPYRLQLSPGGQVGWLHARSAVAHAGRTELWHTRIGKFVDVTTGSTTKKVLVEADDNHLVSLRAIWSPDFVDHATLPAFNDETPFRAALKPRDRAEIVILTSGAEGYFVAGANNQVSPWVPVPIRASRLFLSSLGGWLTSRGSWPSQPSYTPSDGGPIQSLDLSEWDHLATQGRDHYVRVVTEGFLFPFGHRASLITVTERKVVPPVNAGVPTAATAYLKQHQYIVVREREKSYPGVSFKHAGREMPFSKRVRVRTLVTPYIDAPTFISPGGESFWINVGGSGFPFHLTAVDLAGK